jgi:ABC-2 type transport system ATP-binding protein
MNENNFLEIDLRAEEIKNFVMDNNLNRATVRLIDFAREFQSNKSFYNETLLIRKTFTKIQPDIRIYGYTKELELQETQLSHRILKLTDEILENNQSQTSPKLESELIHDTQHAEKQINVVESISAGKYSEPITTPKKSINKKKPETNTPNEINFSPQQNNFTSTNSLQESILPLSVKKENGDSPDSYLNENKELSPFDWQKLPVQDSETQTANNKIESIPLSIKEVDISKDSQKGAILIDDSQNILVSTASVFNQEPKKEPTSQNDNEICRVSGVHKTYKRNKSFTLKNIDLTFREGEITGLIGENGNGKTTLINIIAGELTPDKGHVFFPFLGSNHSNWSQAKKEIGYLTQRLPRWRGSLKDNLHFSASLNGLYGKQNEKEVEYITYRLSLEKYQNLNWDEISGGFQTRFALASLLIWNPKLLILDEPLSNLDINAQVEFLQDIRDLANSKTNPISVIITSQHLHEIESVADKIIFLEEGDLKFYGSTNELGTNRKKNFYEISATISGVKLRRDTLFDILFELAILDIEETGLALIVHTPTSVSVNDILRLILSKPEISLEYFRDISCSTKILLRKRY